MTGKTLTLEEFKEVGTEMSFLANRMTHLYVKITNGNGKERDAAKLLKSALKSFGSARSKLEDQMFEKFGDQPGSDINTFYGNTSLPADIQIIKK
ncbi:hypothetical protein [Methanosarcina sp. UBA289]|uniref:hypothetical protein n=1 Tax=Methanosarcina sp. UBA289 TaxID=1915574 RepID=UPI0025CC1025|nr:hypothetical protein [Methanosarcina sp. UBA289]